MLRSHQKLDERSRARGPVDHADVALDAVAHEVGVGHDEGALVAQPSPAANHWQGRHRLALHTQHKEMYRVSFTSI